MASSIEESKNNVVVKEDEDQKENKEMSKDEVQKENKEILDIIYKEMKMKYNTEAHMVPLHLYVVKQGVEEKNDDECKWWKIVYGKDVSSIRVCALQDYSVLMRYYEGVFYKQYNDSIHDRKDPSKNSTSEEDDYYKQECVLVEEFVRKHLRPDMKKRGLIGVRGYCKSTSSDTDTSASTKMEETAEYIKWFVEKGEIVLGIIPGGIYAPIIQSKDLEWSILNNFMSVIACLWSIQAGLYHHPDFPVKNRDKGVVDDNTLTDGENEAEEENDDDDDETNDDIKS